jgi:hypothetical protein
LPGFSYRSWTGLLRAGQNRFSAGKDLEDFLYVRQLFDRIYFDEYNAVVFIENNVRPL